VSILGTHGIISVESKLTLIDGTSLFAALLGGQAMAANSSDWDNPLYPVAIATEAVTTKRQPILRVVHEEGHGGWQFYDDAEPLRRPLVVPKEELLALDPTVASVKDLPVGWEATRESPSSEWHRSRIAQ
jgi:hypothetical protein